jgi:hypothetical protein
MEYSGELTLGDQLLLRRHGGAPITARSFSSGTDANTLRKEPPSQLKRGCPSRGDGGTGRTETDNGDDSEDDETGTSSKKRRRNKHAPAEMSSSNPVGRFRRVVDVPRVERRGTSFFREELHCLSKQRLL